ncbi:MAG: hypothetical protein ACC631_06365, partial [Halocynthiibacter sp.]
LFGVGMPPACNIFRTYSAYANRKPVSQKPAQTAGQEIYRAGVASFAAEARGVHSGVYHNA